MSRISVRKWHKGKLIILWAWGVATAALALTDFMMRPVQSAPVAHLVELLIVFITLLALSVMTWRWLGDRESVGSRCENSKSQTDK
jgi:hypothetical protein